MRAHLGRGQLQTQPLRAEHGQQLSASCDQGRELLLLRIGQRPDEAGQVAAAHEGGGQFGQRLGVNAIGLGPSAHPLGEVAGLLGVHHRHGEAGRLQRARHGALIAAGGLHHHQRHAERLQGGGQRRVPVDVIGKLPGRKFSAQHRTIDVRLRHVDTHHY